MDRGQALLEIVRRDQTELQQPSNDVTRGGVVLAKGIEIGATGLEVFGGIISGLLVEHNEDWKDKKRYETVDLMRRGDATVAATLLGVTLPILSTKARVVAKRGKDDAEPDPVVEEAAEFINWMLFEDSTMKNSWVGFLREGLLHLAYGNYVFEKVFTVVPSGEYQGMTGWSKFAPRHPSTIDYWHFDKHGELYEYIQNVTSDAAMHPSEDVPIPADKSIIFTNQEEAGNPLGISVLRPAYKHWRFKDGFYSVQAIAIERQGAGVPYAKYPQGTGDPEKDAAEEMLQNIQAHEQSYFLYAEDWDVGFTDMGAQSVLNPSQAIEHHDAMIPKSVLAGFLNLPQDGRGSFALSSDQSGFFTFSLQTTANYMADVFTRQAIKEIVDKNWPDLNEYPALVFDRVGHLSAAQVVEAIITSVKDGAMTPDVKVENRLRDLLNLAPIEEADFEEAKEPPETEPGETEPEGPSQEDDGNEQQDI